MHTEPTMPQTPEWPKLEEGETVYISKKALKRMFDPKFAQYDSDRAYKVTEVVKTDGEPDMIFIEPLEQTEEELEISGHATIEISAKYLTRTPPDSTEASGT